MEVNFYEMYLEEMALIPVLEAEEEKKKSRFGSISH